MGKNRPSPAWLQLFPSLLASVTVNSCSEHVSCSKKQFWQMAACIMVYKEWYPKIIAFVLHLNSSCFHCKYEVLLALSCGVWYWQNNLLRCHWREKLKKKNTVKSCQHFWSWCKFWGLAIPSTGCLGPAAVSSFGRCRHIPSQYCYMSGSCAGSCNHTGDTPWIFFPQITAYTVKYRIPLYSMALPHGWVFQLWKIAAEEKVNFCML